MASRSSQSKDTARAIEEPKESISLEILLSRLFRGSAAIKAQSYGKRWGTVIETFCLFDVVLLCLFVRLFPFIRGESTIYDFDPYFNHRTTKYLAKKGFSEFWNWYDDASWYPLGRPVGQTLFPGLMTTSYVIYKLLRSLGLLVTVTDVSTFLPPVFSCLTALVTHCFTKHASGSTAAGLFAALFVGISPAYVKMSLIGAYDNECIAIFAMLLGFYLWTRAVQRGTMMAALLAAAPSAYMATSWGGYVFLLNVIAIHMVALFVLGLVTPKHQVAYVVFYVTITALCVNVPFLNFTAIWSSEHMASHGVFLLVVAFSATQFVSTLLPKSFIKDLRTWVLGTTGVLVVILVAILTIYVSELTERNLGKTSWSSRSLTLLDPTYASKHVPIVASVSEHQPTTWTSYFLDLHITIFLAPLGLIISLRRGNGLFFIGLYGVLACYFSAVMVRLVLVLSPAASMLAGVGASVLLTRILCHFGRTQSTDNKQIHELHGSRTLKQRSFTPPFTVMVAVLITLFWLCVLYIVHCTWISSTIFSNRSLFLGCATAVCIGGPIGPTKMPRPDDFREAYHWFRQNTHPKAKIMAWWDYGYQVSEVGNRTVILDNNTWNSTHIATVGLAFASEEEEAYSIAQDLDIDYVFVVFGGMARFASDDLNKLIWMVRIACVEFPKVQQSDYLGPRGQFTVGRDAPVKLKRSLMYKLSYHRFSQATKGFDFARRVHVDSTEIQLKHFEEVYTTENWIVRIYKVRNAFNRDERMINAIGSALP